MNRKMVVAGLVGIGFVLSLIFGSSIIETNKEGWYKVKQAAVTGTMTVRNKPGMFAQTWGDIYPYKKMVTVWFSQEKDEGGVKDTRIKVRFNDGGVAMIAGNARFNMPAASEDQLKLHRKFRGSDSVVHKLFKPTVIQAVQLSAVLMNAEESYTTRRSAFIDWVRDQLDKGVYQTESKVREIKNEKTGEVEKIHEVKVKRDKDGNIMRNANPLNVFGITLGQLVIKDIEYESGVEKLIQAKREALMETVKAKAEAQKAIQERITAEEVGRKNVMVTKYEQEKEKIKAVVKAQQELEVAVLDKKAAEQYKQKKILQAAGDAEYKRRVLQADGALAQKLSTYENVMNRWAEAIEKSGVRWVPDIIMGGQGGKGANASKDLIDLLTAKTAKDLSLDMKIPRGATAKK